MQGTAFLKVSIYKVSRLLDFARHNPSVIILCDCTFIIFINLFWFCVFSTVCLFLFWPHRGEKNDISDGRGIG